MDSARCYYPYPFDENSPLANGNWTPIPELRVTDSNLILIMLNTAALYTGPLDDQWFITSGQTFGTADDGMWFAQHNSILGCAEQHQFCNPISGVCTPPGGFFTIGNWQDAETTAYRLHDPIGLNAQQQATVSLIMSALWTVDLCSLVNTLQANSLRAQSSLFITTTYGYSTPLAPNQTAIEVRNWHDIILAAMQRRLARRPRGQHWPNGKGNGYGGELAPSCHQQKVRDQSYTSISVLGMGIILGVGGFTIVLSWFIAPITAIVRKRLSSGQYKRFEWDADELLQVQR